MLLINGRQIQRFKLNVEIWSDFRKIKTKLVVSWDLKQLFHEFKRNILILSDEEIVISESHAHGHRYIFDEINASNCALKFREIKWVQNIRHIKPLWNAFNLME